MTSVQLTSVVLLVALAKLAPCAVPVADLIRTDLVAQCQSLRTKNFQEVPDAQTQVTTTVAVEPNGIKSSHCLVSGYISPNIGIKIGLPSQWNGRFLHSGCGGHCGSTADFDWSCAEPLGRGYACIVSDMGHQGTGADGLWAYNNLLAKVDWGFRATHVVTLAGKAITESFYGTRPSKSYFVGGSTGGRQALQEAQKFPSDFDGIVAIAPPVDLSAIYLTFAWGARVLHGKDGEPIVGRGELQLLTQAALNQCDMDDGVRDQVIGDPLRCDFDPASLVCGSTKSDQCLSQEQVDAVKKIYDGPTNSVGEKLSGGGPLPGSELGQWDINPDIGWAFSYLVASGHKNLAIDGFRYLFFWPDAGPSWQLSDFDFDRDSQRLALRQVLYDSSNPDLRRFKAAGGKLIILQGLNDNAVLPRSTIDYYETVTRTMGGRVATQSFARLYLLPGVGHDLPAGQGAGIVDYMTAIEKWVEEGEAPDKLIAARVKDYDSRQPIDSRRIQITRPVYPYPIRAKYKGRGNPDSADSFYPFTRDGDQTSSTAFEE